MLWECPAGPTAKTCRQSCQALAPQEMLRGSVRAGAAPLLGGLCSTTEGSGAQDVALRHAELPSPHSLLFWALPGGAGKCGLQDCARPAP